MNKYQVARHISDIINITHLGRFSAMYNNNWVKIRRVVEEDYIFEFFEEDYIFEFRVDDHISPETFKVDFRELNTNNRKTFILYEDDNEVKLLLELL